MSRGEWKPACWAVSMVPWGGVMCAVLRCHLIQAFPFTDEETEMQRGWGICSQLTVFPPPPFIFLIIQESGSGRWGVALISILCTKGAGRTAQGMGALPTVPKHWVTPRKP